MFAYKLFLALELIVTISGGQADSFTSCVSTICTVIDSKRCNGCALACNYKHLTSIPRDLPKEAGCLFMNNNRVRNLSKNELTELTQLADLDISFNKMESIEDRAFSKVGKTLISLRIHQNRLRVINKTTFAGLSNLKSLHIDHNLITAISDGAFDDLVNIRYVQMGQNRISVGDYNSLPIGCFTKMTNLFHLEIHYNNITGLTHYRGDLLQNLTNLDLLLMDGISNGVALPEEFLQISNLTRLRIYGKKFNMIRNDTFVNLSESPLQELWIDNTELEMIDDMAFSHLPHLQELQINDSPLGLCRVQNAWPGLQKTNLSRLSLSHIVNPYSSYMFLPCNFFKRLGNRSNYIETLFLENNNLIYIDKQISSNLSSLETLSLEFNRLQSIHTVQCSDETEEFSYNPREIITCYKYCSNDSKGLGKEDLEGYSDEWASGVLHLPKSIRKLWISAAVRFDARIVPGIKIIGCSNLNHVRYRSSNIRKFFGPIYFFGEVPESPISIDLRGNYARYLDDHFFGNISVSYLDLGDNALSNQLHKDEYGNTFRDYDYLKTLNISNNGIKYLPEQIFIGLVNLRALNLSDNSLTHFTVELSHMKHLRIIDLSRNLFNVLTQKTMDLFDQLSVKTTRPLEIDLRLNQFVCSCETLPFLNWVLANGTTVKSHKRSYRCFYKSELITFSVYEDAYRMELVTACSSKAYLFVSLSLFLATLFALAVTVVAYRHRWDIKFFIVRLYRRKQWNEYLHAEENEPYEFHAFVAYHDDDFAWVRNELLNNLENTTKTEINHRRNPAIRLCVHDRDFIPGIDIEENILNGIQSSRKCIVVLTRSFLGSGWCEFELRMARFSCFEKKKNTIIVVMLEPIPLEMLTPSLNALIRRTTILEWPCSSRNRPLFWDKLRQAISSAELTPLTCDCGRSIRQRWSTRGNSDGQVGQFLNTVTLN